MPQTFKHAIIVCHPAKGSFTRALADRYADTVRAKGHEVVIRDLYEIGFDPVLREEERRGHAGADVDSEWAAIGKADVTVLVYPIWFGAPPAMMMGYIDRVFGAGRALGRDGEGGEGSNLRGTRLVSLTASGSNRAWLNKKGVLDSLRTVFDRYLSDVFGFAETARYHFDGVGPDMTAEEAAAHLAEVEKAATKVVKRLDPHWEPPAR